MNYLCVSVSEGEERLKEEKAYNTREAIKVTTVREEATRVLPSHPYVGKRENYTTHSL